MKSKINQASIGSMFDSIARRYDLLNHILSLGLDRRWRRRAVQELLAYTPNTILDLAAGTGDMSLELLKQYTPSELFCADLAPEMLAIGKRKIESVYTTTTLHFVDCMAEKLPFQAAKFDAVMIGFGIRNFANIPQSLKEIYRVLAAGGVLIILEFSMPQHGLYALLYRLYLHCILPILGGLISGSFKAYNYLPSSMVRFARENPLPSAIAEAGLHLRKRVALSWGAVQLLVVEK